MDIVRPAQLVRSVPKRKGVRFVWAPRITHYWTRGSLIRNDGAAVIPILGPYLPLVRLDNGARDRQPHAYAFGLAGEEWFKDLF
jgi:hypothetical protein